MKNSVILPYVYTKLFQYTKSLFQDLKGKIFSDESIKQFNVTEYKRKIYFYEVL